VEGVRILADESVTARDALSSRSNLLGTRRISAMKAMGRTCILALTVAALAVVVLPQTGGAATAFADEPQNQRKKSVDAADVYFGDAAKWEKPSEVDPDKVYAKIEEYKQIVDQGLKPGDPKYDILMCKASKRFTKAVKKTAKDAGYDLVARKGAVKGVETTPPEVTSDVISNL
jgi:hypothetical protein